MSVKVSSWVWHGDECRDLMGNELVLMLSLADVADDNGRCRYLADDDDLSYDALARKVRVDRRTIERLIPKLRNRSLLSMTRGSKTRPNEMTILVPWSQEFADKVSGNGSGIPRHGVDIPRQEKQDSPTTGASAPLSIRTDVRDVEEPSFEIDLMPRSMFDGFWDAWPKKVGKPDAKKAWDKAVKVAAPELILAGAIRYRDNPGIPEKQFIPYPATWLRREGWNDELPVTGGRDVAPLQRARDTLDIAGRLQDEADRRRAVGA